MDAIDKIHIKLKKLIEYIRFLDNYKEITLSELEGNFEKRGAIERYLHLATESVLDIANLLNAEFKFRPAESSKESISILGDEGVLDKKFAEKLSSMAGFRNILVHDYMKLDYSIVLEILRNKLADFNRFAKEVAKYLR